MPKLLFLVSSAREIEMSNGTMYETGFFADEAMTPYERFTEAGLDVVVATPDGRSPYPDPYGLEEIFHYPDEDEDFLGTITRTFAHDVDDIRLTLRHLTELGMIASRRVFNRLKEAGMTPVEARELINAAALDTWRNDREFLPDCLAGLAYRPVRPRHVAKRPGVLGLPAGTGPPGLGDAGRSGSGFGGGERRRPQRSLPHQAPAGHPARLRQPGEPG